MTGAIEDPLANGLIARGEIGACARRSGGPSSRLSDMIGITGMVASTARRPSTAREAPLTLWLRNRWTFISLAANADR
jgi:hypothetical protein